MPRAAKRQTPSSTVGASYSEPVRAFAGLTLDSPRIMGVINVTPDSFSDGGDAFDGNAAVRRGLALLADGADILDVGGESTRPRAEPVTLEEELRRVVAVVRALAKEGALVSVDTRRARVMESALAAGAKIVNDVTALLGDPDSLKVVARTGASVILMHMRGDPRTMQDNPRYDDVVGEVGAFLATRIDACLAAGIPRSRIAVDPGIGFGKTVRHNLSLLKHLDRIAALGCALVLGVSRKSFIGKLSQGEPPKDRIAGSIAAALAGIQRGAHIVRVHDVGETAQALAVWNAIGAAEAR
ncbi:MAG: dihydropteroate synthase [Rhodospirillales bacterium]|nr:dihydropteroate synthase [Rhodospirillales bacterium]